MPDNRTMTTNDQEVKVSCIGTRRKGISVRVTPTGTLPRFHVCLQQSKHEGHSWKILQQCNPKLAKIILERARKYVERLTAAVERAEKEFKEHERVLLQEISLDKACSIIKEHDADIVVLDEDVDVQEEVEQFLHANPAMLVHSLEVQLENTQQEVRNLQRCYDGALHDSATRDGEVRFLKKEMRRLIHG